MTPEEEAYEEALRRIRVAEKTGAVELDLNGMKDGKVTELETLTRLPQELDRLTSLQSLCLEECKQLSGDLRPHLAPIAQPPRVRASHRMIQRVWPLVSGGLHRQA
jgi:hypothetical protein